MADPILTLIKRRAHSAREISERLGITRASVYAKLARLQEQGAHLIIGYRREGARGPTSATFQLE
jgi:biotin operon repressor